MKKSMDMLTEERGSILVIALIVLMMLTLIGIAITTTASLELQIAGNDRLHKTAFYKADGGTEIGYELLEQNLGCASGFAADEITGSGSSQAIKVVNKSFWQDLAASMPDESVDPTTTNADDIPKVPDFYFPKDYVAGTPHTNFTVGGNTVLSSGSAIQMVSGYEGKGKGAGGGGAYILYDMYAQHIGVVHSQSIIKVQWRHVIGQEGACNY